MNELDAFWQETLTAIADRAAADGRGDVAEYLNLKAANDRLRVTAAEWLFASLVEISEENERIGAALEIENEQPHNFPFGKSNLVGSLLRLRQGLRCLTLEAGWTRTPSDGFMRNGALAAARLSHFGLTRHNTELLLLKVGDAPQWFAVENENTLSEFGLNHLRRHFQIFLGAA